MERGAHAGGGFLAELVTPWVTHAGAVCSRRTAPPGKRGKYSRLRSLWRSATCGRDPVLEQGKSVKSPPSEKEGVTETMSDKLTATPIPCPLMPFGARS